MELFIHPCMHHFHFKILGKSLIMVNIIHCYYTGIPNLSQICYYFYKCIAYKRNNASLHVHFPFKPVVVQLRSYLKTYSHRRRNYYWISHLLNLSLALKITLFESWSVCSCRKWCIKLQSFMFWYVSATVEIRATLFSSLMNSSADLT